MHKHSITFSDDTGAGLRGQLLDFLGLAATVPVAAVDQRVSINLQEQLHDLETANNRLAKEAQELEAERDQYHEELKEIASAMGWDNLMDLNVLDEVKSLQANLKHTEEERTRLAAELTEVEEKVAQLRGIRSDMARERDMLQADLVNSHQRIKMLEADVCRLGNQLAKAGAPVAVALKAGDLVTVTWPDGTTKAPGIIRGDDPESGRFHVEYFDLPPNGTSGDGWFDLGQLAPRSGHEPGDPPAEKAKPRRTRTKRAEPEVTEVEGPPTWPASVNPAIYAVWERQMIEQGLTEGLNPFEFKRLADAGLIDMPKLEALALGTDAAPAEPQPTMIVNGVPLDKKLEPMPDADGVTRSPFEEQRRAPYPNPAAPPEVQAATVARAEFEALPEPTLESGAKVACWTDAGAIAIGHLDQQNEINWQHTTLAVRMLTGDLMEFPRESVRGVELAPEDNPEPTRQLAGVGAGSVPAADDDFTIDGF